MEKIKAKIKNFFNQFTKENIKKFFKNVKAINIIVALLGGALLGFTIRNVHEISPVTEGGSLGLALLIDHWLNISSSITLPIIDVIVFLIAFKVMGKYFMFYSLFAIIGYSSTLAICEVFPPLWPAIADNPLIAAIVGGIGVGISCGACVIVNSGPTVDDALAMSIQKVSHINLTVVYLIEDLIVLGLSLTYIKWQLIMYSLLTVMISGGIIGLMEKIHNRIKLKHEKKLVLQESDKEKELEA